MLEPENFFRRPEALKEHVASLADVTACREVEHLLALDRRVERPIEVVQRFQFAELSTRHRRPIWRSCRIRISS